MSQIFKPLTAGSPIPPAIVETLTGNTGIATAVANNINVQTANTTVKFVGSSDNLIQDFGIDNLLIGVPGTHIIAPATENVSLGIFALSNLTSGTGNTAIGNDAGFFITTGSGNCFLGAGAGQTGNGDNNTFIGNSAGDTNIGNYNIFLGHAAGSGTNAISSTIVIGSNAGSAFASNSIIIGTQGTGNGEQNACFIAGINGVTSSNPLMVTINSATNQLGTAAIPAGTVTSVSGTANQVSVATGSSTAVISLVGPYTPATYTAHGVLIGAGTSSIAALAAGSAGQVLQSGGASANPAYSTATYPAVGTSTGTILIANGTNWVATTSTYPTTNAINTLLYASSANVMAALATANNGILITSASGVPSILADGTTGQVLTATAGAPPAWASVPSSFAPNATLQLVDDFTIYQNSTGIGQYYGSLSWQNNGILVWNAATATDSGHPGILANPSAGFSYLSLNSYQAEATASAVGVFVLGGGIITVNWVIKINTLSTGTNTYTFRCGLSDDATGVTPVNGVYFEYSSGLNSGNWNYNTAAASARTVTNSSTAVTTGWHNLQLVINAAASSISFSVDGSSLGTAVTTNIPTLGIAPFLNFIWVAGTVPASALFVDLFYLTEVLTTPR